MIDVRVPGSLDNRQQELLRELAKSFEDPNHRGRGDNDGGDEDKGLFEKIKEVLG